MKREEKQNKTVDNNNLNGKLILKSDVLLYCCSCVYVVSLKTIHTFSIYLIPQSTKIEIKILATKQMSFSNENFNTHRVRVKYVQYVLVQLTHLYTI